MQSFASVLCLLCAAVALSHENSNIGRGDSDASFAHAQSSGPGGELSPPRADENNPASGVEQELMDLLSKASEDLKIALGLIQGEVKNWTFGPGGVFSDGFPRKHEEPQHGQVLGNIDKQCPKSGLNNSMQANLLRAIAKILPTDSKLKFKCPSDAMQGKDLNVRHTINGREETVGVTVSVFGEQALSPSDLYVILTEMSNFTSVNYKGKTEVTCSGVGWRQKDHCECKNQVDHDLVCTFS